MTYIVKRTDGSLVISLLDQIIDTTATSLTLVGRGHVLWGEAINNNLVHLLENAASPAAPITPLTGQLWFNTVDEDLNVSVANRWYPLATEDWVAQNFALGLQTLTFTQDVLGSGSTNVVMTLATTGVTAGTYSKVQVDTKGRVVVGLPLLKTDVTTALAFSPVKSVNTILPDITGNVTIPIASGTVKTINSISPDGAGNVVLTYPSNYVKQGGGIGQLNNNVFIGWNGTSLQLTVDASDFGSFAFRNYTDATFVQKSGDTMSGELFAPSVRVGLPTGNAGVVDFLSSGASNVYDGRINVVNGTPGVNGKGDMILTANSFNFSTRPNINGTDPLTSINQFFLNRGQSGFQKLPSGLIFIWGNINFDSIPSALGSTKLINFTFPTTFPFVCLVVLGNGIDNGPTEGSEMTVGFTTFNTSGAIALLSRSSGVNLTGTEAGQFNYLAIGY